MGGGEGDSLHSDDSEAHERNDDSDHFADDEAVSNADSSSQENLDEMNYLADDETYTQFFKPPVAANNKVVSTSSSASTTGGAMFALKLTCTPVTSITFTSTTTNAVSAPASAVSAASSNGISGVVNVVTGGGGVMGVGASSSSIAESLSRLAVSGSANTSSALHSLSKQIENATNETAEGSSIMEKYAKENLNIHTRGLLRKRVPIIDMISWTKDAIRKPLLSTVDKSLKGSAGDMFRLVQVYMGDRKSRPGMTLNSVALDIVTMAYTSPSLRDELYVQLCKQTTDNHKK